METKSVILKVPLRLLCFCCFARWPVGCEDDDRMATGKCNNRTSKPKWKKLKRPRAHATRGCAPMPQRSTHMETPQPAQQIFQRNAPIRKSPPPRYPWRPQRHARMRVYKRAGQKPNLLTKTHGCARTPTKDDTKMA